MAILNLRDKLTKGSTETVTVDPMQSEERNIRTDDGGNLRLDRRSANGDRRVNAYDPNYSGPCRRYTIERRDTDLAQGVFVNENPGKEEVSIIEKMIELLDQETAKDRAKDHDSENTGQELTRKSLN